MHLLRVTLLQSTSFYLSTLWYILVLFSYQFVGPTSVCFLDYFQTQSIMNRCCSSYVTHDLAIGYSSIWLPQYYWVRSANNADSMQIIECAAPIKPVKNVDVCKNMTLTTSSVWCDVTERTGERNVDWRNRAGDRVTEGNCCQFCKELLSAFWQSALSC